MDGQPQHIVVFVTASSTEEAQKIAQALLRDKRAACVNVVDGVDSFFWWQGAIDRSREALLVIKSHAGQLEEIIKLVESLHSYDVPEIIALPIIGGLTRYLRWIDESVGKPE